MNTRDYGLGRKHTITMRVSDDELEQIEEAAEDLGESRSGWIRRVVELALSLRKNKREK